MAAKKYRLTLAVELQQMPDIALALQGSFPLLAEGVQKQWLEMLNSGADIFGHFEQGSGEPDVGLAGSGITFMTGISD